MRGLSGNRRKLLNAGEKKKEKKPKVKTTEDTYKKQMSKNYRETDKRTTRNEQIKATEKSELA